MTINKQLKRASRYSFEPTDNLFFDTNIWLFIYPATPVSQGRMTKKVEAYTSVFKKILGAGSTIHIDVLVLSEFIYRYVKIFHKANREQHPEFKSFRKSTIFRENFAPLIIKKAQIIMNYCFKIENDFVALDVEELFHNGCSWGDLDFNDQMIARLCKKEGLKLVTDDGDFNGQELFILTENRKLLN